MRGYLRQYIDRQTLATLRSLFHSIQSHLTMSEPSQSDPQSPDPDPQFDPLQPSTPISYPLKTMEELESRAYFDSFHFPFNKASVKLRMSDVALPDRPRLLVCHDMAGGYGDDRWVQGGTNDEAYGIWHWYLIDVFVYFSHSLVTLPPPGWVNAAHRHGVKVLGTFITEWDEGRAISNKFLVTKESAHMYAERLAELAEALGFDGWLINMEVELDREQIPNMKEFVSHLTEKMHAAVEGSLVIWYDSVTTEGKLHWQDQLNDKNKPFFDICDGIFVNYTWKENYPKLSALAAGDRKFDVYMGIDIFGRGSFGGGQWNINVPLDVLKQESVSAALFAPGWVYETKQLPDFQTAHNRWWSIVEESWGIHKVYPAELPFCINFDQGRGSHFSGAGMQLSDKKWCNISLQSLQPLLPFSEDSADNVTASVDFKEASFSGGGNITLKGNLEDEAYSILRLFKGNLHLGDSSVTFTYSVRSNETSRVGLSLDLLSPSKEKISILLASWGNNLISMTQFADKFSEVIMPRRILKGKDSSGWIIQESSLLLRGYTITQISAVCYKSNPGVVQKRLDYASECLGVTSGNSSGFYAVLGHIMAKSAQQKGSTFPPSNSWLVEGQCMRLAKDDYAGSRPVSVKVVWKLKIGSEFAFPYFNIFVKRIHKLVNGNSSEVPHHQVSIEFLGVAHTGAFYVSGLAVAPETAYLKFIIQASHVDGTCQSIEDSPSLLLDVEG